MVLPEYVKACMDALEEAGFAAYAVGGCVRDALLGLPPQDYDLCTNALPEETETVFSGMHLVENGKKHGTVGVITGGGVVEITTFRTEGGYADNRHPDWVRFVPEIEKDLARRDFTVNAMAYSPKRGFADPFGGRVDLQSRVLRAVGDPMERFSEDSLRILRGARFAAKYRLSIDPATKAAMEQLAPLMDNLARERVFDELCKLLLSVDASGLLQYTAELGAVIPELQPTFHFDQCSPHHAYDLFAHIAQVTGAVPAALDLRWAALLHDIGKVPTFTRDENGRGHFYGHAQESARMAEDILKRLKAPTALREQAVFLIEKHMTKLEPTEKTVRRWLSRLGEENLNKLLTLQEADMGSKGTGKEEEREIFPQLRSLIAKVKEENSCLTLKELAVNGHDLKKLGLEGRSIGAALEQLLDQVLEEQLPNERCALLEAARAML